MKLADAAVKEIEAEHQDVIILNFANPDMVGHSGMLEPTIKASKRQTSVWAKSSKRFLPKAALPALRPIMAMPIWLSMQNGRPFTAHTTNPVPFIVTDKSCYTKRRRHSGRYCTDDPDLLDCSAS